MRRLKGKLNQIILSILSYVIILGCIITCCMYINISRRIKEIDSVNVTLSGYYRLRPMNYVITDNLEENRKASQEALNSEAHKNYTREKESQFFNKINSLDGFYVNTGYGDVRLDIFIDDMHNFPLEEQVNGGYYYPGGYEQLISEYSEGIQKEARMNAYTFICDLTDIRHTPILKGEFPNGNIPYVGYYNTQNPMPVAIGYGLKDLFEIGDVVRCYCDFGESIPDKYVEAYDEHDVFLGYNIKNPDGTLSEEIYSYDDIFPDGNMSIKITGIMDKGAYYEDNYGGTNGLDMSIVLPHYDVFNTSYSDLKTDEDRQTYLSLAGNISTCVVYTSQPPDKAHEIFMNAVREIGQDDYIKDTTINADYHVKGRSIIEYRQTILSIFVVLAAALVIVTVFTTLRLINKRVRTYSIHYMLGSTTWRFCIAVMRSNIIGAVLAGLSAFIFGYCIRDSVANSINAISMSNTEIIYLILLMTLCYIAFVFIISAIRIFRTDFSKILKENV